MNDTTNQMSLLDAIGLSEPEEAKPKKEQAPKRPSPKRARGKSTAPAQEPTGSTEPREDNSPAEKSQVVSAAIKAEEAPAPVDGDQENETGASLTIRENGPLPLDQHLCFALYSANHAMHGVYKALLKEVGLTYPQFLTMTVLWEKNNVPVGAITSKLQLDTNTLTPLLKRLEAMGLLTRTRSAKDERQVFLKLTRKGKNLQKKTEGFSSCIFNSTGLTLHEITDLQAKIMTLRDNLRTAGQS